MLLIKLMSYVKLLIELVALTLYIILTTLAFIVIVKTYHLIDPHLECIQEGKIDIPITKKYGPYLPKIGKSICTKKQFNLWQE